MFNTTAAMPGSPSGSGNVFNEDSFGVDESIIKSAVAEVLADQPKFSTG